MGIHNQGVSSVMGELCLLKQSLSCEISMSMETLMMRALAKSKEIPPNGFMSPGGWKVLIEYYDSLTPVDGKVPVAVAT